jgi:hypothetical protein
MFAIKAFLIQAAFLWSVSVAQTCSDLNLTIYQDPADIVSYQYKTGNYIVCPQESMYWEHHPKAFGMKIITFLCTLLLTQLVNTLFVSVGGYKGYEKNYTASLLLLQYLP